MAELVDDLQQASQWAHAHLVDSDNDDDDDDDGVDPDELQIDELNVIKLMIK